MSDFNPLFGAFENILGDPKAFDKFQNNPVFRLGVQRRLKSLGQSASTNQSDLKIADMMTKFKIVANNGRLQIHHGPLNESFNTLADALQAIITNPSVRQTTHFSADAFDAVGGQTSEIFKEIFANKLGYTVTHRSHDISSREDLARLRTTYGVKNNAEGIPIYPGYVQTGKGKVSISRVWDKEGNELTGAQIRSTLHSEYDLSGSLMKRGRYVTSPRQFVLTGMDEMPRVRLYDPIDIARKMIGEDRFKELQQLFPTAEALKDAAEKMTTGQLIMTQTGHVRQLTAMRRNAEEAFNNGTINKEMYRERIKSINRQLRDSKGGYNTNLVGAIDSQTGKRIDYLKGDVVVGNDAKKQWWMRALGISDEKEFDAIDLIASSSDVSHNMVPNELGHLFSLDPRPTARSARTNLFSLITHQDDLGGAQFYFDSTMKEIEGHLTDLKAGKLTGGLVEALRGISKEAIDPDLTAGEIAELRRSKDFAKKIVGMIDSGAEVANSPSLMAQITNSIENHYIRRRQGHAKGSIIHRGAEGPYYELSFPGKGLINAHLTLNPEQEILNMASIDEASSRWNISPLDTLRNYAAEGGSDLDDSLTSHAIAYDPKTRRAFVATKRDPTGAGEIAFKEADLANITFDSFVPEEIRTMHGKMSEINSLLRNESRKSIEGLDANAQRRIMGLIRQRDSYAIQIRNYFEGNSVKIRNGKKITGTMTADEVMRESLNVREMDLGSRYGIGSARGAAPKGYARTEEAAANYQRRWFSHGYNTTADIIRDRGGVRNRMSDNEVIASVFNIFRQERDLDTSITHGGILPYQFSGFDASEFHDKYFANRIVRKEPEANKRRVSNFSDGEFDRFLAQRLEDESNPHYLGKIQNLQKSLESNIRSHLDSKTGLSDRALAIFDKNVQAANLSNAATEDVVDAAVKTMNLEYLMKAESATISNMRLYGEALGKTRRDLADAGISESVGIDPFEYYRLIKTNEQASDALLEGWRAGIGDANAGIESIFLAHDDKKAFATHLYDKVLEHKARIESEKKDIVEAANARHLTELEELGFKATPEELTRASQFLQTGLQTRQAFNSITGSDSQLSALLNGEDISIDASTEMIRDMHAAGLFEEVRDANGMVRLRSTQQAERHVLAMSQILAQNGVSDDLIQSTGFQEGAMNINSLMNSAMKRLRDKATAINDISNYSAQDIIKQTRMKWEEDSGRKVAAGVVPTRGSKLTEIVNPAEAAGHLQFRIEHLLANESEGMSDAVQRRLRHRLKLLEEHKYFSAGSEYAEDGLPTFGTRRFALREGADAVADTVTRSSKKPLEMMRTLDKEGFRELMKEPIARRSLIGAGVLAGFGILYRLTHDPTPEEMQGPPLLPDGNPYDGVDMAPSASMSSLFPPYGGNSAQGMLYQIRASGNFDPAQLHSAIQSTTGMRTTGSVHKHRKTIQGRQSSPDVLKGIMGG